MSCDRLRSSTGRNGSELMRKHMATMAYSTSSLMISYVFLVLSKPKYNKAKRHRLPSRR